MRHMVKNTLIKLAYYILQRYRVQVFPIPPEVTDLLPFAATLCDRHDAQSAAGTSGEWKRDRVYNQIANTVPNVTPKHIHMAILLTRFGYRGRV